MISSISIWVSNKNCRRSNLSSFANRAISFYAWSIFSNSLSLFSLFSSLFLIFSRSSLAEHLRFSLFDPSLAFRAVSEASLRSSSPDSCSWSEISSWEEPIDVRVWFAFLLPSLSAIVAYYLFLLLAFNYLRDCFGCSLGSFPNFVVFLFLSAPPCGVLNLSNSY